MTSKLLLRLAERVLSEIPNHRGIPGLDGDDVPHPFNGMFSSRDLADAIGRHLKENSGFTVILGYPAGNETYSGTSGAATWEEAVSDVARQMLDKGAVSTSDELSITDVIEGLEHSTFPGTDRYAVVRFNDDGEAIVMNSEEVAAADSMGRETFDADDRIVRSAADKTRRLVMGETTTNPDGWRNGEKREP